MSSVSAPVTPNYATTANADIPVRAARKRTLDGTPKISIPIAPLAPPMISAENRMHILTLIAKEYARNIKPLEPTERLVIIDIFKNKPMNENYPAACAIAQSILGLVKGLSPAESAHFGRAFF